jgi:hypothetical protein
MKTTEKMTEDEEKEAWEELAAAGQLQDHNFMPRPRKKCIPDGWKVVEAHPLGWKFERVAP